MKTIIFVFGTRPEIIKLAPVILELRKYPEDYRLLLCNTEQQKELSNQTLKYFGLKADINLNSMSENQTLAGVQAKITASLDKVYDKYKPDATIIQGDTMTVLCGALVSYYHKVPVFYVEAGLRSYNIFEPFPEEIMRQMASRVTALHFAPTEDSKKALVKENIGKENISVVGNTVIDALFCLSDKVIENAKKYFDEKSVKIDDKLVLVTVHRRENHGERLDSIIKAISGLAEKYSDHTFVLPVHPNPNVKIKIWEKLRRYQNIKLLEPLDYPNLVYLMKHAKLILTDSGGIQEEAPTFKCPTLVMRYETERKEGIKAGASKLVGSETDKILKESEKVLSGEFNKTRLNCQNPYGDGKASIRIEKLIREYFGVKG